MKDPMWVQVMLFTLAASSPAPAPVDAVTWADTLGTAEDAPGAVAARAGARAFADAAARVAPLDGLRAELQPGAQFRPFDAVTSPAGQLVLEGTTGAGALLGSRRDQARSDAAVLDAEAAAQRLGRRLQLSDAWCDRRAAELAEAAARKALDDARALQERLERLQREPAAGLVLAVDDVIAVRALAAEAALAVLDAEAARLEAGLRLGRLLGRPGEVAATGPLPSPAQLLSSSSSSLSPSSDGADGPELARAQAAVVAAKAALLAFERELWPTVGLGVQAQVDDASTGFAYGRVSLTLPRVDGDPRGRAELLARVHLAEAELEELRRARVEHLATAHHEVEHQQHTLQLVEEGLVPAAVARREVAEKRLALGAGEVFELVAAARTEREARRRAALAQVGVARARVTLALLDPGHLDGGDDHEGHAGHHDDDVITPVPLQEPR